MAERCGRSSATLSDDVFPETLCKAFGEHRGEEEEEEEEEEERHGFAGVCRLGPIQGPLSNIRTINLQPRLPIDKAMKEEEEEKKGDSGAPTLALCLGCSPVHSAWSRPRPLPPPYPPLLLHPPSPIRTYSFPLFSSAIHRPPPFIGRRWGLAIIGSAGRVGWAQLGADRPRGLQERFLDP